MFITNNHNSFHLCWHETFVKHQKLLKYYVQDCGNKLERSFNFLFFNLLEKCYSLNYMPKHFHPITLLNYLIINVSGRKASMSLVFCVKIFTKEKKDNVWDYCLCVDVSRHAQWCPKLSWFNMSTFVWLRGLARLRIVYINKLNDSLEAIVFFPQFDTWNFKLWKKSAHSDCRMF